MKKCPGCGTELSSTESESPSGKTKLKTPFTIGNFLWDNFRLFTMIGITGTMISLIPNMGSRILGATWITDSDTYLPLFLSIIIFFGTLFLTICFLLIFSRIFDGRDAENCKRRFTLRSQPIVTWYDGDFQRFILLFCLVPMWFGLTMFFIQLMPLIPNKYSWFFAAITGLTLIPLAMYSLLGWNIGKTIAGKIPGMRNYPQISMLLITLVVIGCLVIIPLAISLVIDARDTFSGSMKIRANQQYFSPGISTAQGLKLDLTNVSGRELLAGRQTWSADYGYFISIIPSTSEVAIMGNPVYDYTSRDIYWTFSKKDPGLVKKPVRIDVHLYSLPENKEIDNASLFLTWFNDDIVYVNTSFEPSP